MNAHGIGVHDERTFALAEVYDAVGLLNPAEQQSDENADDGADGRYHAALEQEYLGDLFVVGSQVAQRHHIVFLVDHQHRERTDDVEAGHDEDERQEDIGNEFLYFHDAEGVFLLFVAVEHLIFSAGNLLHLGFHVVDIAARLYAHLERRNHALLVEYGAGKADGGDDVVAVVERLLHGEHHAGRDERVFHKSFFGIHQVKLSLAPRGIDFQIAGPVGAHAHGLCQPDAQRAVLQVGGPELERAVAIENLVDMSKLGEVIVDALNLYHRLTVAVDGQRLVFHGFGHHVHFGQLADFGQDGVVGSHRFPFDRHHLQLRVEGGEQRCHQVVESVEHRERHHQSNGCDGHAHHRNGRNQVNHVRRFLREQIPLGNVKWEVHHLSLFSSSSMWSI